MRITIGNYTATSAAGIGLNTVHESIAGMRCGLIHPAPMAFLEAAIQAAEERVPVLVVARVVDAPLALEAFFPSELPLFAAIATADDGRADLVFPLSGDQCLSLSLTRAHGAKVA